MRTSQSEQDNESSILPPLRSIREVSASIAVAVAELAHARDVNQLVTRARLVFDRLDEEVGAWFADIVDADLLDLGVRLGKAPGAYCASLARRRMPFLFMNAGGHGVRCHNAVT